MEAYKKYHIMHQRTKHRTLPIVHLPKMSVWFVSYIHKPKQHNLSIWKSGKNKVIFRNMISKCSSSSAPELLSNLLFGYEL